MSLPRGRLVKVQSEVGVKASKKLNFQLRGTRPFPPPKRLELLVPMPPYA